MLRRFDVSSRRGFTLLEVLIVAAILAILATLIVPRMLDREERVFKLTCDRVADLLTMYARRESLSQVPVGLRYEPDNRWLSVVIYDVEEDSPDMEPTWRYDSLIRPVRLPPPETAELVEVRGNGRLWDTSVWPLASKPGQDRPTIEVVMQGPHPDRRLVHLVLPPYAVAPRQFDRDDSAAQVYTPIDLNTAGRMREDW